MKHELRFAIMVAALVVFYYFLAQDWPHKSPALAETLPSDVSAASVLCLPGYNGLGPVVPAINDYSSYNAWISYPTSASGVVPSNYRIKVVGTSDYRRGSVIILTGDCKE